MLFLSFQTIGCVLKPAHLSQALLVIYSIAVLSLSGDTKVQISSAYHDLTRTALQTIKERGWVSSRAEEEAKRFTIPG